MRFEAAAKMRFSVKDSRECAGIILLQNGYNQLRIEAAQGSGRTVIRVVQLYNIVDSPLVGDVFPLFEKIPGTYSKILGRISFDGTEAVLKFIADGQSCSCFAGADEARLTKLVSNTNLRFLGSETSGRHVGMYIGMFASGNGAETNNAAAFDWFDYGSLDRTL